MLSHYLEQRATNQPAVHFMSNQSSSNINILETAYTLTIGDDFSIDQDPDVIDQLLADTRSPNTKRAYEKDLKDFFLFIAGRLLPLPQRIESP
jgi:hypothetical protein